MATAVPARIISFSEPARQQQPTRIPLWDDYLAYAWSRRACFVCGVRGNCEHRQRDAEPLGPYHRALRRAKGGL